MCQKLSLKTLPVALSLVLLTGCMGSIDGEPDTGAAQNGNTQSDSPYTQNADSTTQESDSNTAKFSTRPEFDFRTSGSLKINLDIPEARGEEATVSLCTEYNPGGTVYEINYDSCLLRAPLIDGRFKHEISLTNQFEAVVAAVWFQNPDIAPVMREFRRDTSATNGFLGESLSWY